MAIDIGLEAIDRPSDAGDGRTRLTLDNPANATGTLTQFEVWARSGFDLENCKIGTFSGSAPNYTSRDVESVGTVTAGSKQTFSGLDCDVETGDFIGTFYDGNGKIERTDSGFAGSPSKIGDQFGAGSQAYDAAAGQGLSLYGSDAVAGWTGKVSGVTNPAKVLGVAVANISKVSGVS